MSYRDMTADEAYLLDVAEERLREYDEVHAQDTMERELREEMAGECPCGHYCEACVG